LGKAPAFQFYTGDWRKDVELHKMTFLARGIWIEMLMCMWDSNDRGKLEGSQDELSRIIGCTKEELVEAINELSVTKTADVTNCNGKVTIINRRMYREEKYRKNTKLRVFKYREKHKNNIECNVSVTPPSSSSSSSSTSKNKKNIVAFSDSFNEFWKAYPERNGKKVGKAEAFKEWQIINPDESLITEIHSALRKQKQNFKYIKETGDFVAEFPDACRWLKRKRWTDEVKDLTQLQHEKVREAW